MNHERLVNDWFGLMVWMTVCVGGVASPAIGQWCSGESGKLNAPDGSARDRFGTSVALKSGRGVVGAYWEDTHDVNAGAAYLFDLETNELIARLESQTQSANDNFGFSVGISDRYVVVGAPIDTEPYTVFGSAYLFDAASGDLVRKFNSPNLRHYNRFGTSVALNGSTAVVGAPGERAAYLFDSENGDVLVKLGGEKSGVSDYFGHCVAISDRRVVVGASHSQFYVYGNRVGSAYLYNSQTGALISELSAPELDETDRFAASVDVDERVVVVGAPWDDDVAENAGAAYVFDAGDGAFLRKLLPVDGQLNDYFGESVSVEDGLIYVGSPRDDEGGLNTGSVYVFDALKGGQIRKLYSSDAERGDQFGLGVAVDEGVAIVGAFQDDDLGTDSGSAYVFEMGKEACVADLVPDCLLNTEDFDVFVSSFKAGDLTADVNGDGQLNYLDVSAFLAEFASGCS